MYVRIYSVIQVAFFKKKYFALHVYIHLVSHSVTTVTGTELTLSD